MRKGGNVGVDQLYCWLALKFENCTPFFVHTFTLYQSSLEHVKRPTINSPQLLLPFSKGLQRYVFLLLNDSQGGYHFKGTVCPFVTFRLRESRSTTKWKGEKKERRAQSVFCSCEEVKKRKH